MPATRNSKLSYWPTGSTKLFAVIGDPIDHSLSPALLNTAFADADIDAVFVALKVSKNSLGSAIEGMRSFGISGLSVTMPHKESIIRYLDTLTPRSRLLNSVNCVYWDGDLLVGDSTDGPALVEALEIDMGGNISGKSVLVLGTGGAARAIVLALAHANVREIVVVGRRPDAVLRVVDLGGGIARSGIAEDSAGVDIIVNATSVGMADTDGSGNSPIPFDLIREDHFVCDIIYFPLMTPLLQGASSIGAGVSNGIGMLTLQASRAFTIWTGKKAPLQAMLGVANAVAANRLAQK